jgi:hypothetical protein
MKIKISSKFPIESDVKGLSAALDRANGKASVHTYLPHHLPPLISQAEKYLTQMQLPPSRWHGVRLRVRSGRKVPGCYKYSRRVTCLTFERGTKNWFLIEASSTDADPNEGEIFRLEMTPDQYAKVHDQLDQRFSISKAEVVG